MSVETESSTGSALHQLQVITDPKLLAFQEQYTDTDHWQSLFSDYKLPLLAVIHRKTGEVRFCGDEQAIRIAEEGNNRKVNEAIMQLSPLFKKQRRRASRKRSH